MNSHLILLTPLLVLLILAVYRFTGCSQFTSTVPPAPDPGTPTPPLPPPGGQPPVVAPTYEQVIAGTLGYLAHWRLNERGGNEAKVLGSLNPLANGLYVTGSPAGTGVTLGAQGVLFHKDKADFAPEFGGSVAYVEVSYQPPLNPANKPGVGFSVELWIKPNLVLGADTQTVISSHRFDAASKQQGYEIDVIKVPNETHQQVKARVFSGGTQTEVTAQPVQGEGDPQGWRHIVLTYQGGLPGSISLYVRVAGTLYPVKHGPVPAPYQSVVSANPSTLRFGANHRMAQAADNFFAGRIDEVAFYSSVLLQSDIDNHFKLF